MIEGRIKKVVADRGFGFLELDGSPDVFFHISQLNPREPFDESLVGRAVTFDTERTDKGVAATGIRFVGDEAPSYGQRLK